MTEGAGGSKRASDGHPLCREPARDWERMVAFYSFPKEHWKHLRTTTPVESPFAAVRIRTTAAKRYKKVEKATAVIWKTLMIVEKPFRRLDAPELLAEVAEGAVYVDGMERVPTASSTCGATRFLIHGFQRTLLCESFQSLFMRSGLDVIEMLPGDSHHPTGL